MDYLSFHQAEKWISRNETRATLLCSQLPYQHFLDTLGIFCEHCFLENTSVLIHSQDDELEFELVDHIHKLRTCYYSLPMKADSYKVALHIKYLILKKKVAFFSYSVH